ncbi:MAG TPA: hypothetical protein VGE85_14775 [Terracidiphilus sp.]|jgi:hypothetical protein
MSEPELQPSGPGRKPPQPLPEDRSTKGPSLALLFGLLALALAAAIGFALLIVLPFYHRR